MNAMPDNDTPAPVSEREKIIDAVLPAVLQTRREPKFAGIDAANMIADAILRLPFMHHATRNSADGVREALDGDLCPSCGALPCDWTDNPFKRPSDEQLSLKLLTALEAIEAHCRVDTGAKGKDHASEGQRIRRATNLLIAMTRETLGIAADKPLAHLNALAQPEPPQAVPSEAEPDFNGRYHPDVERCAAAVHYTWSDQPGYVPWVEHGNSDKQDEARSVARRALSAQAPGDSQ